MRFNKQKDNNNVFIKKLLRNIKSQFKKNVNWTLKYPDFSVRGFILKLEIYVV